MKYKVYTEDTPEMMELSDIAREIPMATPEDVSKWNTKRLVRKFAWFPRICEDPKSGYDVYIVWLRRYDRVEIFFGQWEHYTNYLK